jgi:hypothetical protein
MFAFAILSTFNRRTLSFRISNVPTCKVPTFQRAPAFTTILLPVRRIYEAQPGIDPLLSDPILVSKLRVDMETINRLCNLLNVPVGMLLEHTPDPRRRWPAFAIRFPIKYMGDREPYQNSKRKWSPELDTILCLELYWSLVGARPGTGRARTSD